MEKEDVAEIILDMNPPTFKCPIERCKIEAFDPTDFLEHLKLDHSFEELLDLFEWDIVNGKIEINNNDISVQNVERKNERNLDEIMRIDDSSKDKRQIVFHLTSYFLDCKMIPNVNKTRYYNVMSHSKHIATIDCWDIDGKNLIWSYIAIHDGDRVERKIDCLLENKKEKCKKDWLEIAKEIANSKYYN